MSNPTETPDTPADPQVEEEQDTPPESMASRAAFLDRSATTAVEPPSRRRPSRGVRAEGK